MLRPWEQEACPSPPTQLSVLKNFGNPIYRAYYNRALERTRGFHEPLAGRSCPPGASVTFFVFTFPKMLVGPAEARGQHHPGPTEWAAFGKGQSEH